MNDHNHSDFLTDLTQYEQAEAYWRKVWMNVQASTRLKHLWFVCVPNILRDGTREREGNPIFWAVCEQLARSIRIIQVEPSQSYPDVIAWVDEEVDWGRRTNIQLVIQCAPNTDNELVALRLLEIFADERVDRQDLETEIEMLLPTRRSGL